MTLKPHRGRYPYLRKIEKMGIGLLTSSGFHAHHADELSLPMKGRPMFIQLNATERGLLINAYVPKAWILP